ncbi:MAG: hypothetical protein NG740_07040 [Omnitrophica bacterium]|nr:hypothetical protein [Candidatus Omnitrophota bacterium]
MFKFIAKNVFVISLAVIVCGFSSLIFAYYIINNRPSSQETVISSFREPQAGTIQPVEQSIRKKIIPTPPKKESLPLRLVGIYEHDGKKVACIEDLVRLRTGYYAVGSKVRGAALIQILPGGIVLLKDGRKIILTLDRPYNWATPGKWIDMLPRERFIVGRGRLNGKIRGINDLLDEIIVVPNISNAGIDGFRITSLKENGIINQAGFEKGDIIKGVNGERLNGLKKPLKTYAALRRTINNEDAPVVKIELERDNKALTFTYRILQD